MATVRNDRARERAEARRREIAERQAKEARRRLLLRILLPVLLVVVVVAAFVVVRVTGGSGGSDAPEGVVASGPAPASVVQQVTTIPAATFDTAGTDGDVRAPDPLADGQALTANGLPRVLYVGAEFCPFCAAERWVVVTSLARFGTFTDLGQTNSSPDDVHPNTATLSFHGATYASNYLSFTGYETSDVEKNPLDTLSTDDEAVLKSLDPDGTIPFQDLGGKFTQNGSSFDPGILADKTHEQIASAVADPTSAIGKAVLAASNLYTAALCTLTDGRPGDVCTSAAVTAAAAKLGS